jgi:hypothetical protein
VKFDKKIKNLKKKIYSPKGIVSKIFFSISSPSLAVISDAMNPGATAFTWKIVLIRSDSMQKLKKCTAILTKDKTPENSH